MDLILRYRVQASESINVRHQEIMTGLLDIDYPWGLKGKNIIPISYDETDLVVQVNLSQFWGDGLIGGLMYQLRNESYLEDNAQSDDLLLIEIDRAKVDYSALVKTAFPSYINAFRPYRGTIITDLELSRDDFNKIREQYKISPKDINGRDGVYRINTVNYWDRELCRRAFNLSPEEIIEKLQNQVETISLMLDGVLLIVTSEFLERKDLEEVDTTIRNYLGVPPTN